MEYLDHSFTIGSCDMDLWGFLKPTAILNICQETAYMHSSLMGFGFERLVEMQLAWVLSRAHIEVARWPQWRERINVRTWHKGESGLFGLRDYIFSDADGEPIIRVTSSWLVINIASRRVTRIDRIFAADSAYRVTAYPHDAIEEEAPRVESIEEGVSLDTHIVTYSDLDVNHHVNNAKYMEWACDHSPQQMERNRKLCSFTLNFNHEAKFGDSVELSSIDKEESGESLTVVGNISKRNIFTFCLNYCDR